MAAEVNSSQRLGNDSDESDSLPDDLTEPGTSDPSICSAVTVVTPHQRHSSKEFCDALTVSGEAPHQSVGSNKASALPICEITGWVLSTLGSLGFVIGSVCWCIGPLTPASLIFIASCFCYAISCFLYGTDCYKSADVYGVFVGVQQVIACVLWMACSYLFLYEDYKTISLLGFYAASQLFVTSFVLVHISKRSWFGPVAQIIPKVPLLIPITLTYTIGSCCFGVGSALYFYSWGEQAGGWLFVVGSAFFCLATCGDITLWLRAKRPEWFC